MNMKKFLAVREQTGTVNVRRTLKIDAARLATIRDVETYLGQDSQGVWHRLADARTRLASAARALLSGCPTGPCKVEMMSTSSLKLLRSSIRNNSRR